MPSHRLKTRPRPLALRVRALSLTALAVAVAGSALLGAHIGRAQPADGGAAADAARTRQVADRGLARTAPPATPSAAAAPGRPAPRPTVTRKPARPAPPPIPPGCRRYRGNQLIACRLLPAYGFSTSQMGSLVRLWNGESDWNTRATNPDSGAYGIPQALPAEKLASAGSNWRYSAETQIRWGLAYIRASYGTPDNAWTRWSSRYPHWY